MYTGRTVFAQIMELVPWHDFRQCVKRYRGDSRVRSFSCGDQFRCLVFGQLSYRESLRDLVACLSCREEQLYHLGIRGNVRLSTFADANEKRDYRIYRDLAMDLISSTRQLYRDEPFGIELKELVYAVDATIISLPLTLFHWADYKRRLGGIKVNTTIDLRGNIPSVIDLTTARVHDVKFLDRLFIECGAFYLLDRGYFDYARLYRIHQQGAWFVTRPKKSYRFRRLRSSPVDRTTGLRCDQRVRPDGDKARRAYLEPLRRISYDDRETGKRLIFLTNNFTLDAKLIADLYRCRWQVELFFRWLKQHLRIRAFYGTSENAVHTQVWTAIIAYVLVARLKRLYHLPASLYQILQILSLSLFEKVPLPELLTTHTPGSESAQSHNQLILPNL